MDNIETKREIVNKILNFMEYYSYPNSFLKMLMSHLELDDQSFDKNAAIDKIILLYEQHQYIKNNLVNDIKFI